MADKMTIKLYFLKPSQVAGKNNAVWEDIENAINDLDGVSVMEFTLRTGTSTLHVMKESLEQRLFIRFYPKKDSRGYCVVGETAGTSAEWQENSELEFIGDNGVAEDVEKRQTVPEQIANDVIRYYFDKGEQHPDLNWESF